MLWHWHFRCTRSQSTVDKAWAFLFWGNFRVVTKRKSNPGPTSPVKRIKLERQSISRTWGTSVTWKTLSFRNTFKNTRHKLCSGWQMGGVLDLAGLWPCVFWVNLGWPGRTVRGALLVTSHMFLVASCLLRFPTCRAALPIHWIRWTHVSFWVVYLEPASLGVCSLKHVNVLNCCVIFPSILVVGDTGHAWSRNVTSGWWSFFLALPFSAFLVLCRYFVSDPFPLSSSYWSGCHVSIIEECMACSTVAWWLLLILVWWQLLSAVIMGCVVGGCDDLSCAYVDLLCQFSRLLFAFVRRGNLSGPCFVQGSCTGLREDAVALCLFLFCVFSDVSSWFVSEFPTYCLCPKLVTSGLLLKFEPSMDTHLKTEGNLELKISVRAWFRNKLPTLNVIQTGNKNGRSPNAPPYDQRSKEWNEEQDEFAKHKTCKLHKELLKITGHCSDVYKTCFHRLRPYKGEEYRDRLGHTFQRKDVHSRQWRFVAYDGFDSQAISWIYGPPTALWSQTRKRRSKSRSLALVYEYMWC